MMGFSLHQFLNELKLYFQDMLITDRIIFILVGLTFFFLPIGTAPPLITIILAFLTALFSGKFFDFRQRVSRQWIWPLLAMIILPWVGLLYAPELTDLSWDYARKTHYWLYAILIALIPLSGKVIPWIVKAFLAGLLLNALLAMVQFAGFLAPPAPSGIVGYFGFGVIYSALSIYLVAGILMASLFFKNADSVGSKVFYVFLILLFLFHIIIMDGRNGYVTFVLLSPMVAINLIGRCEWKKVIPVCLIFIFCMSFSPVLKNRLQSTVDNLKAYQQVLLDDSWGKDMIDLMPRFYLVRSAVDLFIDHPLVGVGTGGYYYYISKGKNGGHTHPHSNILYMGVSFGLLGIVAYFWLCWIMLSRAWGSRHQIRGYFSISIFWVIFISGFFNSQILDSGPALFFALGYGLIGYADFQNE